MTEVMRTCPAKNRGQAGQIWPDPDWWPCKQGGLAAQFGAPRVGSMRLTPSSNAPIRIRDPDGWPGAAQLETSISVCWPSNARPSYMGC